MAVYHVVRKGNPCQPWTLRPAEALIPDGQRVVALVTQESDDIRVEVLIDLESHQAAVGGKATTDSREGKSRLAPHRILRYKVCREEGT